VEEKYLYTIAIIVVFAGFLFTSIGNYTGYYTQSEVQFADTTKSVLEPEESVNPYYQSNPEVSSSSIGYACVVGKQWTVPSQDKSEYRVCIRGFEETKYCSPGEEAIQRGDYVECKEPTRGLVR